MVMGLFGNNIVYRSCVAMKEVNSPTMSRKGRGKVGKFQETPPSMPILYFLTAETHSSRNGFDTLSASSRIQTPRYVPYMEISIQSIETCVVD